MIHPESVLQYQKSLQDYNCGYAVPSSFVMVTSPEGKHYLSPDNEDDYAFLDRIERSRKAGRNLFYEEWPEYVFEPNACI